MDFKHIVLFPLRDELGERILNYMDQVAAYTRLDPPHRKLLPHVTFHRPIEGINESRLVNLVAGMATMTHVTRMRYAGLDSFGMNYIVLPIQATQAVAALWAAITTLLSTFPEYEHGPYDHDNTLQISLAGGTHKVFSRAWPHISRMHVEPRDIVVDCLEIHRKPVEGGAWEFLQRFDLQPRNPTPA